ncbi:hypothetical protein E2R51_10205 [Jeotgalibacillus sp. S-D1]|uniref:tetratricopeptide repeat protein n=1 Tax=Jeotgalibacillus sp. S-D1 TaxID=2552189 RepID=UPI001059D642|nr:hypothetical protein [Jeotgalibacillus sp. S-D1]TDL33024.1 hypothetical protein E2R51_10205 [Jeotgalibacillus sp. S-D1]
MNHLTTITLMEKGNRKTLLTPIRMAVHSPCSILEATSSTGDLYHAYFYRQQFLAAKKITRSKRSSYLEQALTKGIVFLCPHPVVDKLVSQNETFKNRSLTDLLSFTKRRYTPIEVSQIFRCMDSLIQGDKLFKVMRDVYYDYRRDGKWGKAYSVLLTLEEAFPENQWIASTKHDASFSSYHEKYELNDESLLQHDRSTLEWKLWKNREHPVHRSVWMSSFGNDPSYSIASFSLLYEEQYLNTTEDSFSLFLDTARHHFTQHELKDILIRMADSEHSVIHQAAFRQCIRISAWEEAMTTLIHHPFDLSAQDSRNIKEAIPKVNWDNQLPIEQLSMALIPILKENKHELDSILTACIPILSKTHNLAYLVDWLKPLEKVQCNLPIYQRVQKLLKYAEDPNQQALAGELYYQLGLNREAIDSFSYEMELNPEDPSPVKWLSTLYRETGQADEAAAYQQLLQSMR